MVSIDTLENILLLIADVEQKLQDITSTISVIKDELSE